MKKVICIVCPRGCEMLVEVSEDHTCRVIGNACNRGKEFAFNETFHPTRTVQTTVKTAFHELPVISVKTSDAVPKECVFQIIKEAAGVEVKCRMKSGDIIIENVLGTGVNIVSTMDMSLYID